jgi:hypothetical protein
MSLRTSQKFTRKQLDKLTDNYQRVVVEVQKAYFRDRSSLEYEIIDCYIPAEAKRDESGNIVLMFEKIYDYDVYRAYSVYNTDNCPSLYDFYDFDLRYTLLMSLGVLLGYDKDTDLLKPFVDRYETIDECKPIYEKWWKIDQLYDVFRNPNGKLLKDVIYEKEDFKNKRKG